MIGGAGNDTLVGGEGDDTYVVNDASDTLIEEATAYGGLFDTVESSVTFTLQTNFERLLLQGSDHLNGTGNSADNFISGNSGDNVLTGNAGNDVLIGGTGADTMQGGAGDDSYTVDKVNDVVIDLAGEGTDTVNTTVSWTLGANTENVNVNSSDSIQINGNSGANLLTFTRRPAGDDYYGSVGVRAAGGAGDDRYVYALVVRFTGDRRIAHHACFNRVGRWRQRHACSSTFPTFVCQTKSRI